MHSLVLAPAHFWTPASNTAVKKADGNIYYHYTAAVWQSVQDQPSAPTATIVSKQIYCRCKCARCKAIAGVRGTANVLASAV